jgi:hypothetical protein
MISPKLITVFRLSAIATGAAALSLPFVSSPANAFSFTGFNFKTNFTTEVPTSNSNYTKYDIRLDSVGYDQTNGYTTPDLAPNLVKSVTTVNNNFLNNGPMSSDKGDLADGTIGTNNIGVGPVVEKPTDANLLSTLRTRNLNSLVDTEDSWSGGQVASIDVIFDNPTDRFFFWERGMNSGLKVEALGTSGVIEGSAIMIGKTDWKDAGFSTSTLLSINTTEIGENQKVGAYGLVWSGGNIVGLRISAEGTDTFNGPDFQVRAANPVPEPLTILGSGIALAFGIHAKRKLQSSPK